MHVLTFTGPNAHAREAAWASAWEDVYRITLARLAAEQAQAKQPTPLKPKRKSAKKAA